MDRIVDLKGNNLFTSQLSQKEAIEVIVALYGAQRIWFVGYLMFRHT